MGQSNEQNVEERQNWYFTFMQYQEGLNDKYVKIPGTFGEAREKMAKVHGSKWGFQYSEEEFNNWKDLFTGEVKSQAEAFGLTEIPL